MASEGSLEIRICLPGADLFLLAVPGGISILKLVDRRERNIGDLNDPQLRERIRTQLVLRKSARLAEGYLQELRRDALIENNEK